jgi:hypothetical protein
VIYKSLKIKALKKERRWNRKTKRLNTEKGGTK